MLLDRRTSILDAQRLPRARSKAEHIPEAKRRRAGE
jgi:hypothetical protein